MLNFFNRNNKLHSYNLDDILTYYSKFKKKPINSKIVQVKKPLKYDTRLSWR